MHDPIEWAEKKHRDDARVKILLMLFENPVDDLSCIIDAVKNDFILSSAEIGWRIGGVLRDLREEGSITEDNGKFQLTESMRVKIEELQKIAPDF